MPIRAILIDLDNTLLLEDQATEHALQLTGELAARRAGADPAIVVTAAREAATKLFEASAVFPFADAMGIWWGEALWGDFAGDQPGLAELRAMVPAFRTAVWTRALSSAGTSDATLVDGLVDAFGRLRRGLKPLDPDAMAVLGDLGREHRLALVTNGAPDVQREKLAGTPLAAQFAAIVISVEVGVGKPDPRIFQAALDALDVANAEAVMVGDSLERDIAGARRAGLRSIWLDRADTAAAGPIAPDARIRSLRELPDSVIGLERDVAFPQPA